MINIAPDNDDLSIDVKTIKYGSFSSTVREDFENLDNEKQLQDMQKSVETIIHLSMIWEEKS